MRVKIRAVDSQSGGIGSFPANKGKFIIKNKYIIPETLMWEHEIEFSVTGNFNNCVFTRPLSSRN